MEGTASQGSPLPAGKDAASEGDTSLWGKGHG